ncbi:MAG: SDR family NAD(P)-dependent oxidoreductase [Paracoccaceae bacterium]
MYHNNFFLSGQTAIVTGGASGIGLATVQMLLNVGANVIIADVNKKLGSEVLKKLKLEGKKIDYIYCDVSSEISVLKLVDSINKKYKSVEILMHFAGIGLEKKIVNTTIDDWNRIISINLTGSFIMTKEISKLMISQKYGRIITMSSVAGLRGGTGRAAYGASKGGVIALSKVLSIELAPFNITVNTLCPGAIETELVKNMHDKETRRAFLQQIPQKRYGLPEEVASAALFFTLPGSSYLNGTVFPVDGGFDSSGIIKNET